MSQRNSLNILSLVAVALVGTAISAPAMANAGHNNIAGPSVSDAGTVSPQASGGARPCYTEPSGFHTNIHWDNACSNGQEINRLKNERAEVTQPKFVEPDGFHKNLRFNK